LVNLKLASVKQLAESSDKNRAFISRALGKFLKLGLVSSSKKGTLHIYIPLLDAKIAYG